MPATPPNQPDEALVDLLVKQVTEGLSPAEQRELDVMDGAVASAMLRDLERAAAAISLAASAHPAPLPEALKLRLEQQAGAAFASPFGRAGAAPIQPRDAAPRARPARSGTAGWWAAAACLLLAIFGWLRTPPAPVTTPGGAPAVPVAQVPPSAAEERAALLTRADAVKLTLGATKDPSAAGVTGDVVWDPSTQRGFIRFVGLMPNDPAVHQYQIWIFDAERDQRYPVDGGVFDIPANQSEVVVPIRAAVPVRLAKAFAVTVEKPGGVVVSSREHVVALAQAG
jgi:hypothetical protein